MLIARALINLSSLNMITAHYVDALAIPKSCFLRAHLPRPLHGENQIPSLSGSILSDINWLIENLATVYTAQNHQ